jgi:hypothetical protein
MAQDKIGDEKNDSVFVMQKSAMGAVLRSAIVPGLGQIYNQSYWKAPIVWGIGAWLVYNWVNNNKDYKTYKNLFALDNSILLYRENRDFYRDQRDLFAIYMGLTYFLQLVDAYVDAQLFDFTVQEDYHTGLPLISFRLRF